MCGSVEEPCSRVVILEKKPDAKGDNWRDMRGGRGNVVKEGWWREVEAASV
jgi:hypothetical protein